jgi:uncharacterized protein
MVRNEAIQESDLDFIVNFDGAITFDRYMDLKIFLEDLFGKKIDLAIEDTLKPQIRQKILEEAIDVWDVVQTKLLPLDEAAARILNEI